MNRPARLAVLGDPLAYTLSPVLHAAGLEALGRAGTSEALRTSRSELGSRLDALAALGYRGVNLTHPLKEHALDHLGRVTPDAARARSVNTVGFEAQERWGDTTDGRGFTDWLAVLERAPQGERAVLLGAGGAARSLALALADSGARVTVAARRVDSASAVWCELDAAIVAWPSSDLDRALGESTMVINATPVSGPDEPLNPGCCAATSLLVDLTYGPEVTAWVRVARARGHQAWDGLGLLVAQARRSLALWFGGETVPFEVLARAVGWPR